MIKRLRKRSTAALDRRFAQIDARLDRLGDTIVGDLNAERDRRIRAEGKLQATLDELADYVYGDVAATLRAIASEEPRNRRELDALREQASYELPFTTQNPLVTICVLVGPGREKLVLERALPSARTQTYENVEIIVVGNVVDPKLGEEIAELGDPRVSFTNLPHTVIHPDPDRHWLHAATMIANEAHRQANGLWITDLDDDDALAPDAVEGLVKFAQEQHVEVAYGQKRQHRADGEQTVVGSFPPGPRDPHSKPPAGGWQHWNGSTAHGAIFHEGLRLFARELVAGAINTPGDYFRVERMLRAGVRFGMLERVTYEYFPSALWKE